jgi:choline dehydrogenase-like flavoprotein
VIFSLPKVADKLGLPFELDMNDPKASPRGYYITDYTIDSRGNRSSTYRAFLPKELALKRQATLTICTGVIVQSLDIDGKAGFATGVRIKDRESPEAEECYVRAKREVIVCSGAACTPQVLMLRYVYTKSGLCIKAKVAKKWNRT